MITKNRFFLLLVLLGFTSVLFAQKEAETRSSYYKNEMQSLQSAIQKNFFDQPSGYYRVVVDPAKWEKKGDYLREYTYIWSLCAMYQAANEIEKLDPKARLMEPLLKIMSHYYDPAPPKPGYSDYLMNLKPGERYYDDNQWIGITALDAYERTREKANLELGKLIFDFMMTGCDTVLGGGIYWKEGSMSSKNTCSNGPGVLVTIQLYQATKDKSYLNTALKIFNWTNAKLQTPSGLYWDNIRTKDGSIEKAIFSYNTGTMLQSNLYLYESTGDKKYLKDATAIADSSLTYFYSKGKFRDNYWFNAVLLRAYQHLLKYNKDTKYIVGFKKCLDYALKNDKNEQGLFTGKDGIQNLVDHGGLLEILARYAWLETRYNLKGNSSTATNEDPSTKSSSSLQNKHTLPGKGLSQFDFFYAGESKEQNMYIVKNGSIAWEYKGPKDKGEISDAVLMTNGNILFSHQLGITLITPEKKVLWSYDAPKGCEIHTAQPIGKKYVVFIQNGDSGRVFIVNVKKNKTVKSFTIPVKMPPSTHGQFRHARLTAKGTLLVAHMDLGKISEYDSNGNELFTISAPGVWGVESLPNGNILMCCRSQVVEVTSKGGMVWDFQFKDIPEYNFNSPQVAIRRPNGNTVVGNWFNQWSGTGKVDPNNLPVQAIEITPDKKVVWALQSWTPPVDLGPSTIIQILGEKGISEHVTFGEFK